MTAFYHSHPYRPLSRRYNTGKNTVLPKRNYCKTILHHYFQIQQKSYVRKRALHLPRYLYLILLKVFSMIQGMLAIWSLVPLPLQKQGSSRKTSTSASLTMLKPLTAWITTNCGKFWKRQEYQTTLAASWETCMQVKAIVRSLCRHTNKHTVFMEPQKFSVAAAESDLQEYGKKWG